MHLTEVLFFFFNHTKPQIKLIQLLLNINFRAKQSYLSILLMLVTREERGCLPFSLSPSHLIKS